MKTVINIKTDKEVKKKAQKVAKELGLPLSTVVNAYLRQFIQSKEVHFSAAPRRMSKKLEKKLASIEKDIQEGKNMSKTFHSSKEAIRYLRS